MAAAAWHRSCHMHSGIPSAAVRARGCAGLCITSLILANAPNAKLKIHQYLILPDFRQNRQIFCTPIFLRLRYYPVFVCNIKELGERTWEVATMSYMMH